MYRIMYSGSLDRPFTEEDFLNKEQLEALKPFILKVIDQSKDEELIRWKERFEVVSLDEKRGYFKLAEKGEGILERIQRVCEEQLAKQIKVIQISGRSNIEHAVMRFPLEEEKVFVQFINIGEFNDYSKALSDLSKIYPE